MLDLIKKQDKRKQMIFGDGEVKKATLTYQSTDKGSKVVLPVQFNPSEYSISRRAEYTDTTGKLQEPHPENLQSKGSRLAHLRVKFPSVSFSIVFISLGSSFDERSLQ